MEVTGPFVNSIRDKNPGPGTYRCKQMLKSTTFTLRGKNYQEDHEKMKIPGPGSCKIFWLWCRSGYFWDKLEGGLLAVEIQE